MENPLKGNQRGVNERPNAFLSALNARAIQNAERRQAQRERDTREIARMMRENRAPGL